MDLIRFGSRIRALRHRRGWRQADLARESHVSRPVIGRIEAGDSRSIAIGVFERVAAALGAAASLDLAWHGEALDRLLDEAHARLVELLVARLRALGWEVGVEVSFSQFGERGSIDVLAWHPMHHRLAVFEVKSVTPDMQAMLAGIDRKARLGPVIARDRGWNPVTGVARILVLADTSTNRRRLARFRSIVDAALPAGTWEVRRWVEEPRSASLAGVWFLADDHPASTHAATRHRIRVAASGRARIAAHVPLDDPAADPLRKGVG